MIVRISGSGQFELDDDCVQTLHALDTELTQALHDGEETRFHDLLHQMVTLVRDTGVPLHDSKVLPSEVIVPPEDITIEEAGRFFTDEGLMAPIPA